MNVKFTIGYVSAKLCKACWSWHSEHLISLQIFNRKLLLVTLLHIISSVSKWDLKLTHVYGYYDNIGNNTKQSNQPDVHGSVHRNINLIERTNKLRPCSRIYYSSVS